VHRMCSASQRCSLRAAANIVHSKPTWRMYECSNTRGITEQLASEESLDPLRCHREFTPVSETPRAMRTWKINKTNINKTDRKSDVTYHEFPMILFPFFSARR
jgi:hypothetical protein